MPAVQPCCQQLSAVQRCKVLPARTKGKEAFIQHFPSSPRVFRENELTRLNVENRMGVVLHQLSAFISGTGSFAGSFQHLGVGCKQQIVGSAWWRFFGSE
jgi:hypothetical protein